MAIKIEEKINKIKESIDKNTFTNDQKEAILNYGNLIVSAGAGCGKTKVLVEKICQFIRVGIFKINEVIIMTFTINATNEMKSRIKDRLNELYKEEDNKEFKRNIYNAIISINSANISTIDSMCKKIVDSNFERLDKLPVNYSIGDDTEIKVIENEVLEDIIEKNIGSKKYYNFFKAYFVKNDNSIKDDLLIPGLTFLSKLSWPEDQFENIYNYSELEIEYNNILKECFYEFENKKIEKNTISISDLSHYALKVLYENKDHKGVRQFSKVSEKMQNSIKYLFVDEYQDTSNTQEELIKAINGNFNKVPTFIVGDIKQSIYRFRNSRTIFFNEKLKMAKSNDNKYNINLISINENFRSNKPIINFVNEFFNKIMTDEICNIDYNNGHEIIVSGNIVNKYDIDDKVEISILHTNKELKIKKVVDGKEIEEKANVNKEIELRYIARRIRDLKDINHIPYSDMVILHQSPKSVSKDIERIFKEYGIPVTYERKSGFYDSYEIRLLIALLKIIDNPMQDIELVSVLNTGIFNVTLDEIAIINSIKERKENYYNAINRIIWAKNYKYDEKDGTDKTSIANDILNRINNEIKKIGVDSNGVKIDANALISKLENFIHVLNKYINYSRYKSASEIIEDIYVNLNFIEYACGLDNHEVAKENLLYFLKIARKHTATTYRDLYNFIFYVDSIVKKKIDIGEAEVLNNEEKIKIESIHQSKGLQYPVVIMPYLGYQFNLKKHYKLNAPLYTDYEKGFSLESFDIENRIKYIDEKRKDFAYNERKETMEEYIRTLYVALTRAEKKLILTMKGNAYDDSLVNNKKAIDKNEYYGMDVIPDSNEKGLKHFADLISTILYTINNLKTVTLDEKEYPFSDLIKENDDIRVLYCRGDKVHEYIKLDNLDKYINKLNYEVRINKDKEYKLYNELKPKYSVSELKAHTKINIISNSVLNNENDNNDLEIKNYLSGTELGNVYHKFMMYYDFDENNILNTLSKLNIKNGSIDIDEFTKNIKKFSESNLCKEMKIAYKNNLLFREQKFMSSRTASYINEYLDKNIDVSNFDENIILQGVIDAFFINENGEVVLLDYKTDFMGKSKSDENETMIEEVLINRYSSQLKMYADSLKDMLNKEIKKKYIYSFKINKGIEVINE